jgi:uncharacterized repeat protein (TIGR03803 family)
MKSFLKYFTCRSTYLSSMSWVALAFPATILLSATAFGQTETVLHYFGQGGDDGAGPQGGVVQGLDGNYYGTTGGGGANGMGTVFRMTPDGSVTTIYSFTGELDGYDPQAALVLGNDGNFYGTSQGDAAHPNNGTVFRITPAGSMAILHEFHGDNAHHDDGAYPEAALMLGSDGNFYGTTRGGGNYGQGTVFRIASSGTFALLCSFAYSQDGGGPTASLAQDSNGNIYGTTPASNGGHDPGNGTVFKIDTFGGFHVLHTFPGDLGNGESPQNNGLVLGNDGNLYGTTYPGYSNVLFGTVYKITPQGTFTTVYSFTGTTDGGNPNQLVAVSDGNLYGTTQFGGTNTYQQGTAFRITLSGSLTTLYSFGAPSDALSNVGALAQGSDGNLYGAMANGGEFSAGDLYRISGVGLPAGHPAFFSGEVLLGNGVYYLQLPNGTPFGYYSYLTDQRFIYHFDMGYEYWFDANDGHGGIFFYDFMSNHFFYTSRGAFPFLYDFSLNAWLYYLPDASNPGRYTHNPRWFFNFATGHWITL